MARMTKKEREELRAFIIQNVRANPTDITRKITEAFSISRQTGHRHLNYLVEEGILSAVGQTKARKYELKLLQSFMVTVEVTDELEEHVVLRDAEKTLLGVPENVRNICRHGFTEMLNNVISHSGSKEARIIVARTAADITISIKDTGIGIFRKIQQDFDLPDPRQALLELTKGKLTSDSTKHTGEGIFFTSRMFDKFMIASGELDFCRFNKKDDWLFQVEKRKEIPGTLVWMEIALIASQTDKEVFLKFAPEEADFGFTRTHVPINLAVYEGEKLISRSQARRLLARVDRFAEVMLDFRGVASIGQPFADETFRVFQKQHPGTRLIFVNAAEDVENMISHVLATAAFDELQTTLFNDTLHPDE